MDGSREIVGSAPFDGPHVRAVAFQGVRSEYVRRVLGRIGADPGNPGGGRALVVGSGRGMLARELARAGYEVAALAPSAEAVEESRRAARREGLKMSHEVGSAERLPYGDAAFGLAYYADTLEVTGRLDEALAEASRVLAPGGAMIYDTVNRSALSALIYLFGFQLFPPTRIVAPGRYAWGRLRRPSELSAALAEHGLRNEDVTGFHPKSPPKLVQAVLRRKSGAIDDDGVARMTSFELAKGDGKPPPVTYFGFALKRRDVVG